MDHLLSKEKGLNTENQVNFILVFSHSVLFSFERLCLSYNIIIFSGPIAQLVRARA